MTLGKIFGTVAVVAVAVGAISFGLNGEDGFSWGHSVAAGSHQVSDTTYGTNDFYQGGSIRP